LYKIIHADAGTGTITVQIDPMVIVLPIDESGNVPTGEALDLIIYDCIPSYNSNVQPKDPETIIANWSEIEDLVTSSDSPINGNVLVSTPTQLREVIINSNLDVF
jgi:hypothetical protein